MEELNPNELRQLQKQYWAKAHLLILAVVFGLYIVIIVAALMAGLSSLW